MQDNENSMASPQVNRLSIQVSAEIELTYYFMLPGSKYSLTWDVFRLLFGLKSNELHSILFKNKYPRK